MKTREDFKYLALKHLDRWHMEELIDFLDEYELVSDRNPQADLRMVHFMEKDVLAIFTSTATDLNIIDPLMESSGIQRLSDRKTRKVIYEILKAQSIQDFKDRLKILKFPSTDKGELVPSMGNFRRLHDAATVFAKRFLRAVSVMSKRAKASDLLPLRGKGKHGEGMIEIFLKTWPKDSTK